MYIIDRERQSPLDWPKVLLLLAAFIYTFINTAWVTEDAFITFRSVDQLLAGHGPVWNMGERVQVYTHPLWYGLLALGTGLGAQSYWFALALDFVLLVANLLLLVQLARRLQVNGLLVLALLFLLSLSKAFMDYSSSGLENPLLHLLLLAYLAVHFSHLPLGRRYGLGLFLVGLMFLTRPDGMILVLPLAGQLWIQAIRAKLPWLKWGLLALLPVFIWESFSLIYYGSLVPNTALAKVNLDYPREVLLTNARNYFAFLWNFDPLTLATIAVALLAGLIGGLLVKQGGVNLILLAMGLALQIGYLFRVGADYMAGRFLSAAMLQAVFLLLYLVKPIKFAINRENLKSNPDRYFLYGLLGLLLVNGWRAENYRYGLNYERYDIIDGIADERGFYFQRTGLLPVILKNNYNYTFAAPSSSEHKAISCFIGQRGWVMPLDKYIIDPLALTEPYLARLPARNNARIGHYERALPPGFIKSRVMGDNRLVGEEMRALYDDVVLVTQGPDLFSGARLAAIWRLNTGHYKNMGRYFDRDRITLEEAGISEFDLMKMLNNNSIITACGQPIDLAKQ